VWQDVFNKELSVFKGKEYDFVSDLKHAYKKSLGESLERQIIRTIPDHYFWDIKKPH
jgi:hypothetical protein